MLSIPSLLLSSLLLHTPPDPNEAPTLPTARSGEPSRAPLSQPKPQNWIERRSQGRHSPSRVGSDVTPLENSCALGPYCIHIGTPNRSLCSLYPNRRPQLCRPISLFQANSDFRTAQKTQYRTFRPSGTTATYYTIISVETSNTRHDKTPITIIIFASFNFTTRRSVEENTDPPLCRLINDFIPHDATVSLLSHDLSLRINWQTD